MNRKKLVLAIAVALVAVFLLVMFLTLAPKTSEGEKAISVEIVLEGKIQKVECKTDEEYLLGVLEQLKKDGKIQIELVDSEYGKYVTGIGGRLADESSEYVAVYVNGEYGSYGVSEQPVTDGDVFTFKIETFTLE